MWKITRLFLFLINIFLNPQFSIAQNTLPQETVNKVLHGVFEVITPQLKDTHIQYEAPLPLHLLSFKQRNDAYQSIGTAFHIGDGQFISAAHVFNLHLNQAGRTYLIRDLNQKVYKIENITKYSNSKDIIQFEIKNIPESFYAFQLETNNRLTEVVYSVGNAEGEGISIRSGTIASYTSEEKNGLWKNIRFTAPASPGNSGGPLINKKGDVIGVILKKNESENLNTAIPMIEVKNLPTKQAQFYLSGAQESAYGQTYTSDWKSEIPLPKKIELFTRLAQEEFINSIIKRRTEFEAKFKESIFPNHPSLKNYLENQKYDDKLSKLTLQNSNWANTIPNYKPLKTSKVSKIEVAQGEKEFFIHIEKHEELSLKEFLENPHLILEAFLNATNWKRSFLPNYDVHIQSLGMPKITKNITDNLGRNWHFSRWYTSYNQTSITLYCLPTPKGSACLAYFLPSSIDNIIDFSTTKALDQYTLSYSGTSDDWREFLLLSPKILPLALSNNLLIKYFNEDKNINKYKYLVEVGYSKNTPSKSQVISKIKKISLKNTLPIQAKN